MCPDGSARARTVSRVGKAVRFGRVVQQVAWLAQQVALCIVAAQVARFAVARLGRALVLLVPLAGAGQAGM